MGYSKSNPRPSSGLHRECQARLKSDSILHWPSALQPYPAHGIRLSLPWTRNRRRWSLRGSTPAKTYDLQVKDAHHDGDESTTFELLVKNRQNHLRRPKAPCNEFRLCNVDHKNRTCLPNSPLDRVQQSQEIPRPARGLKCGEELKLTRNFAELHAAPALDGKGCHNALTKTRRPPEPPSLLQCHPIQ